MGDRRVKPSVARTTALLATVLCAFALLAPTTAAAVTGNAHPGIHLVKAVAAGPAHQHASALRADQPSVVRAGGGSSVGWAVRAATTTSATITPSCTADSPRMRGPPAHGCF
jgi:hypothetical protein